mmetsp:Transcript_48640/g.77466  ORF Transcript_48640/g.77466 Transcript_48640/m.77466 type:complete len:241 (+) Transcript_48640:63-785(+)
MHSLKGALLPGFFSQGFRVRILGCCSIPLWPFVQIAQIRSRYRLLQTFRARIVGFLIQLLQQRILEGFLLTLQSSCSVCNSLKTFSEFQIVDVLVVVQVFDKINELTKVDLFLLLFFSFRHCPHRLRCVFCLGVQDRGQVLRSAGVAQFDETDGIPLLPEDLLLDSLPSITFDLLVLNHLRFLCYLLLQLLDPSAVASQGGTRTTLLHFVCRMRSLSNQTQGISHRCWNGRTKGLRGLHF